MGLRAFSREELRGYNGWKGAPAYVAYEGLVYDVSGSFLWKFGWHQAAHAAGGDLSGALEQAPHGLDMLEKYPLVGRLSEGSTD